jgi:hypothetical protein
MENKRHPRPSFISVLFFLWRENVSGIIESISRLHFEANYYGKEGLFRLGVLSNLTPLFLVDMLHVTGGRFKGSLTSL